MISITESMAHAELQRGPLRPCGPQLVTGRGLVPAHHPAAMRPARISDKRETGGLHMKNRQNRGLAPGKKIKQSAVRQFIVLVDAYRRPSRRRNTAGRYRVGARTPIEAEEMLRKAIGFGSVRCYYEETGECRAERPAAYGECLKEGPMMKDGRPGLTPARRYDEPIKKEIL